MQPQNCSGTLFSRNTESEQEKDKHSRNVNRISESLDKQSGACFTDQLCKYWQIKLSSIGRNNVLMLI